MAWEPREGNGSLFLNGKRDKESQPNYRGDILLNGVLYELSGWIKKTAKGDNFLSLAGKVKEERVQKPAPSTEHGRVADMDSDIPF